MKYVKLWENFIADEKGITFTVYDIDYDADGEDISDLPTTMEIFVPLQYLEDGFDVGEYLGDKITEETGFLHHGFRIKSQKN